MATYVVSDIHGHLRALDRALEMAQPGPGDSIVVLGDMVDRGPDPVGVVRLVRGLPGAHVLMGNHEAMATEAMVSGDGLDLMSWQMNGGFTTQTQLEALCADEKSEIIDWFAALPTFAVIETADERGSALPGDRRVHVLCHAGIDAPRLISSLTEAGVAPSAHGGYGDATADDVLEAMLSQSPDDLLWIRGEFWSRPTGLMGMDGRGPVVVAGHTPSASLGRFASMMTGSGIDDRDRGVVVEVGACRDTGGVADRLCVDCSAAMGHPHGRVGILRLEDRRVWLADIEEGE